jgi:hypothetical protein
VEPDPTLRNAYGELRERFRALYPTLRPFGAGTAPRA